MSEAQLWAGQMGANWAAEAAALNRQLAPLGAIGLDALAPRRGEAVIDLGCGSGATTAALLERVSPGGTVLGIDLSPDQIAAAQVLVTDPAARFVVGDAGTFPFEPASHDGLFSRFGSMFFDEPAVALSHVRAALRPAGRAVFIVWREAALNPWATVPAGVGDDLLGPELVSPRGGPGPFAWAEPTTFVAILDQAGFRDVGYSPAEADLQVGVDEGEPAARAARILTRIGPLARRLREEGGDPAEAQAELARRLAPHVRDGWVRLAGAIWVITATA